MSAAIDQRTDRAARLRALMTSLAREVCAAHVDLEVSRELRTGVVTAERRVARAERRYFLAHWVRGTLTH